jgi:hypothetical protein
MFDTLINDKKKQQWVQFLINWKVIFKIIIHVGSSFISLSLGVKIYVHKSKGYFHVVSESGANSTACNPRNEALKINLNY